MAFDAYMTFRKSDGTFLPGESQAVVANDPLGDADLKPKQIFEIDDFSFDIEQVLNIGSQSSGAGAGKVTFNPYSVTKKTDRSSPQFFLMCCAGQHFQEVGLFLRRAGGAAAGTTLASGTTFLCFKFRLVAVKTIAWSGSDGDESPKEEITFEYGALQVQYQQQDEKGAAKDGAVTTSWNRIKNNNDFSTIAAT